MCVCGKPLMIKTASGGKSAKSAANRGRRYYACALEDAGCGGFVAWLDQQPDFCKYDDVRKVGPHTVVQMCSPFSMPCTWDTLRCDCDMPMRSGWFGSAVCRSGKCKASKTMLMPMHSALVIARTELGRDLSPEEVAGLQGKSKYQEAVVKRCRTVLLDNIKVVE